MSDDEKAYRPKPSKQEAKSEVTTRVAREIVDGEAAKREAKTERLKAARIAKEATRQAAVGTKVTKLMSSRKRADS